MQKIYKLILVAGLMLTSMSASALQETGADSRIKTFVYGKNDVFRINSIYGYQTVVELKEDEHIITISVGNPNIFKIIPSANRLFMKAMQNGQLTNMTVITDQRSYQFEISSGADSTDDMMYVVRFIYPDSMQENATDTPMNLYSGISLPKARNNLNIQPNMPQLNAEIPSSSGILGEMPSAGNSVSSPINNSPLSMQYQSIKNGQEPSMPRLSIMGK